jgi:hypothetical protein
MTYIVALEVSEQGEGLQYIAAWNGDPGRTCVPKNAKRYKSISSATFGLAHARKFRPFINAKIWEAIE